MKDCFIIDAHMHVGPPGVFFTPKYNTEDYISLMNENNIACSVCSDLLSITDDVNHSLEIANKIYEQSGQRIYFLCVFNPITSKRSLEVMSLLAKKPYLVGLKLHPSFHEVEASSDDYKPAWEFAADNDLAIMSHTWSVSPYNPVQKLSTPLKFEKFIKQFSDVKFVLGHFGGRGQGRNEAIQLINKYPNVYGDFAGDIYDYELIENLATSVASNRILFGSDYSWFDPKANILRVLLANVNNETKLKILSENATKVYKIGG